MRKRLETKEKIIIGIVILFVITPVLASLSYAKFIEHLWPVESVSNNMWYQVDPSHQIDSDVPINPFYNANTDVIQKVHEAPNPYVVLSLIGVLGVSFYIILREKPVQKFQSY